jgi:hypothetical protein
MRYKFKENIYGFTYDSINGEILEIINEPITLLEINVFNKYSGNTLMFTDIDVINEMFEFDELYGDFLYILEEDK